MRTVARMAMVAGLVLAGLGLTGGVASAAPAGAQVHGAALGTAQPARASGWTYYGTYLDFNFCNGWGQYHVTSGKASAYSCRPDAGLWALYLLLP